MGPTYYNRTKGTLTQKQVKHLLLQNDPRITENKEILSFICEQMSQHAGHVTGMANAIKVYNPEENCSLQKCFLEPAYRNKLEIANTANPTGRLAKRIIKEWLRFMNLGGKKVK